MINEPTMDSLLGHMSFQHKPINLLPLKTTTINNRRYYDQKNIDILLKIQYLLKTQGMTINGVKKFLNNNNFDIDENEKKIINSYNIKFRLNKINNLIKNLKK